MVTSVGQRTPFIDFPGELPHALHQGTHALRSHVHLPPPRFVKQTHTPFVDDLEWGGGGGGKRHMGKTYKNACCMGWVHTVAATGVWPCVAVRGRVWSCVG